MSKSKDYTIETVLQSSKEYGSGTVDFEVVLKQAPFGLRPYMARFRKSCVPYLAGSATALDRDLRGCDPTPGPFVPQTITVPQISSTATAYTPTLVAGSVTITVPQISSTSTAYTPTLTPGAATITVPQISSTSTAYTPTLVAGSVAITVPQITSTSTVYTPTITAAGVGVDSYTQIISASNPNNSSSMHVGSLYLDARTYTTIGALITDIKGGVGGSNVHVELRRFTNGVALMSASNTNTAGPTWEYVTQSSVTVSSADWYDIYISASGNPATSSIRGIYYEY
jgi:hypothetical protein